MAQRPSPGTDAWAVGRDHAGDVLVVLGSGDGDYRGYALQALAAQCRVVLVDHRQITWQRNFVETVIDADPHESHTVVEALHEAGIAPAGLMTYDEFCVESAASVAAALGLRYISPEAAWRCRDKHAMRQALRDSGVPSARSMVVSDLAAARAAAVDIGYPVVIKPVASAGSIGVVQIDHPARLAALYEASRGCVHHTYGAACGNLLVEEYLDGPEVSVESVVIDGVVHTVALTRKHLGPAPYFTEVGHVVAPSEPLADESDVLAVAVAAHHAVGLDWGVSHTELRLTPHGPRVVEIAARAGGDLIPRLVHLATGVDMMAVAAAVHTGSAPPDLTRPARVASNGAPRAAAVRFFAPKHDLLFLGAVLDLPSTGCQDWLVQFCCEASPGQLLRVPPRAYLDRIGFAVVTGTSSVECEARLDLVERSLQVSGRTASIHD